MASSPPPPSRLFPDAEAADCFVGVALDVPVETLFTYRVPPDLVDRAQPGHRVEVPFRRSLRTGFVVERQERPPVQRVRDLHAIPDAEPLLGEDLLDLGRFVARYYGASLGEALAAMVPRGVRRRGAGRLHIRVRRTGEPTPPAPDASPATPQDRVLDVLARHPEGLLLADLCRQAGVSASPVHTLARRGRVVLEREHEDPLAAAAETPAEKTEPPPLTPDQARAVARLEEAVSRDAFARFLLLGVTGSGKTEVYLQAIRSCVAGGRQAIVLVPEIALTPQTVRRFRARFDRVAVLHSAMTDADRARTWHRIRAGHADVVIGPRSAVFAPVPRLGLLVVDEEHEGSFKQQNTPRYHARDVGLVRAKTVRAVVLLGSATPALESWSHARAGRYELLSLPERVGGRPLPTVQIVDVCGGDERPRAGRHLARTLTVRITEALRERGQIILLQNRRGFATSVACPRCGWVLECGNCDVSLTYHRSHTVALCHLCGHQEAVPPACPDCALPALRMRGVGTQTVEDELAEVFPEARVARMDSDTMSSREAYEDVLGRFGRREIDILVGTQMIAKGLHFPHVTLVGIVSADTSLVLPDFRSAERTFSLVAQVAGRAGRGEAPGRVVVQTTMPDHPAIGFAAAHDYSGFAEAEMADRAQHGYPPWRRLLRVVVRGPEEAAVDRRIDETAGRLREAAGEGVVLLGPAVPPVARIKGRWRRHLLAKCPSVAAVARLVRCLGDAPRPRKGVEEIWDVDPYQVL